MDQLKLLRNSVAFLFRTLTIVEVVGIENMPTQGGCLVCVNHLAVYDPVIVYLYCGRNDLSALVAKKHQTNPIFRWIVNVVGGIWLNRDEADSHAIRAAQEFLRNGGCLGISPEGTRSPTHAMIEAKTGAAYLADKVQVPIVPIALFGTEQINRSWLRLSRPHIRMVIGKPFTLPPLERKDRAAGMQRNTDEIMCQIAALLPEAYRGFYTNHPRISELNRQPSAG